MGDHKGAQANKRFTTRVVGGLVAATIVGGAAFSFAPQESATAAAQPPAATSADLLSIKKAKQTGADQLPAFLREGDRALQDTDFETSRYLGADKGARFWTVDKLGMTCLVTVLPGPDTYTGLSCAFAEDLQKNGIALQFAAQGEASQAYLVPDGTAESLASDDLRVVGKNLLAANPLQPVRGGQTEKSQHSLGGESADVRVPQLIHPAPLSVATVAGTE